MSSESSDHVFAGGSVLHPIFPTNQSVSSWAINRQQKQTSVPIHRDRRSFLI